MSRPRHQLTCREAIVVIPARYASTRLPRKMLLRETGKTLLQHTYEAACAAQRPAGVIVATDHAEIAARGRAFRRRVRDDEPRLRRAAPTASPKLPARLPRAEIVVNVQGDEPEMSPDNIDRVIELLEQNPSAGMATLATPLPLARAARQPGLRESRVRQPRPRTVLQPQPDPVRPRSGQHRKPFNRAAACSFSTWASTPIRRETLLEVAALPPSSLEQAEKLEQLRMLQSGGTILVGVVEHCRQRHRHAGRLRRVRRPPPQRRG